MSAVNLVGKFRYAVKGIVYLWRHESSWRWQITAAVIVQIVALSLQLNLVVWAILTLTSALVLSAEVFNTVLERLFDMVEPRLSAQVGLLKNLLAAAVLIVVIAAVVVATLVLLS